MADPMEYDIEEKKRELQNSVATTIQEKMKRRGTQISESQRSKDLERSFLLLEIRGGNSPALVSFHVRCGNDDEFTHTYKHVEVNLRILKQLINTIDEVVMARVCEVHLMLGSGSPEGEGLAMLTTIRERTEPRTIKLDLFVKNTPISVLTNNPNGKLSELPGVKLETLALDYTCKDDSDNTSAVINYLNTSAMPPIVGVQVKWHGCAPIGVGISDLVNNITQLSSLEVIFHGNDEKSDRDRIMPDAAEWSKLAKLDKLKELNIISYSTGLKREAFPKLPRWSEKSQSLETLSLENVDAEQDFFSAFPQLTSLRIECTYNGEDTKGPKIFSTKTIEEVIAEIRTQRRHLMNLESLEIHGPIIEKTGGSELIRDLCLAIVENYHRDCPKLQRLTLDFRFDVQSYSNENVNENIQQFLSNQKFDRQALSHAPLKIVLSSAWLIIDRHANDKQADILAKVQSAIENLALAVYHSGLQFLTLQWRIFGSVVSRRELDNILEGIKVAHQRPGALLKNLEIDNDDDPCRTVCRIIWKNFNFGGFEQQMELTHLGHYGTIGHGSEGEKEDEEEPNNSQSREAATEGEAEGEEEESNVSLPETEGKDEDQGEPQLKRRSENDD